MKNETFNPQKQWQNSFVFSPSAHLHAKLINLSCNDSFHKQNTYHLHMASGAGAQHIHIFNLRIQFKFWCLRNFWIDKSVLPLLSFFSKAISILSMQSCLEKIQMKLSSGISSISYLGKECVHVVLYLWHRDDMQHMQDSLMTKFSHWSLLDPCSCLTSA